MKKRASGILKMKPCLLLTVLGQEKRPHFMSTINQTSVNLLEAFTSSAGSQTSTPSPQYASTAPQHRDLSTPRSRHAVPGCARNEVLDGYRYR
ncbi:hypothetical protein ATANTOWER_027697 [Ataeniobius toweri]|uniref:Uncharacterized protein n=1 Tax=Ataeniobius toweri TaxID=208326 RepID=A0ABU7BHY2_9TELE|nr:hypothetical protein [Ataeniobius toweri]